MEHPSANVTSQSHPNSRIEIVPRAGSLATEHTETTERNCHKKHKKHKKKHGCGTPRFELPGGFAPPRFAAFCVFCGLTSSSCGYTLADRLGQAITSRMIARGRTAPEIDRPPHPAQIGHAAADVLEIVAICLGVALEHDL